MNLLFTQKMGIQHTYNSGVSCHLCFFKGKCILCLPVTLQLSEPASQPVQHRPNCGAAEQRATLWETTPYPWSWRGKFSIWGLSQPHWPGISMGTSAGWLWSAKFCFLEVCPAQRTHLFLAGYKGKACKDHSTKLPLHDTNQSRTQWFQCWQATAETKSQILWLPESIICLK